MFVECDYGTFGYDCIGQCSTNCFNELPCNKKTGHCDNGCNLGYTDSDCSKREFKYWLCGTTVRNHVIYKINGLLKAF